VKKNRKNKKNLTEILKHKYGGFVVGQLDLLVNFLN